MKQSSGAAILAILLLMSATGGGCDSGGAEEVETAALSGVVRSANNDALLPGVTVSIGSIQTTTGDDGRFTLNEVPIGPSVQIRATAVGHDVYLQEIAVQAGANQHDIHLVPTEIYERQNIVAYLPPDVSFYRGVLMLLAGDGGDFRPLIRGELDIYPPEAADFRQRALALVETQGLAFLGANSLGVTNDSYDELINAVADFAVQSGHSELAQAPLLLWGYSLGGCVAYSFSRQHSERVIGFITQKGGCHRPTSAGVARSIPGYLFIGELDLQSRLENITEIFERNRRDNALWALAIEPGAGHDPVADFELMFNWMGTVLDQRLPATVVPGMSITLSPLDEASGWLGDRESLVIASDACFEGDKLLASWLPTEQTARDWQRLASGGTVTEVKTCGNAP